MKDAQDYKTGQNQTHIKHQLYHIFNEYSMSMLENSKEKDLFKPFIRKYAFLNCMLTSTHYLTTK